MSSPAPVSFWTRSRKLWASAWTKVVGGAGDPTVEIGFDPTAGIGLDDFSISVRREGLGFKNGKRKTGEGFREFS